jgi:DNA-binding beta-propeller fold protein YncE
MRAPPPRATCLRAVLLPAVLRPLVLALAGLLLCAPLVAACGASPGPAGPAPDAGVAALRIALDGPRFARVGAEACFEVTHNGGPEATVVVRWGDGASTPVAPGADVPATRRICHVYALHGPYVVGATVDARGMRAEASRLVTAVHPPAEPAPTRSSTIAFDPARAEVWVVVPDADAVAVIDAVGFRRRALLPVCDRPRSVAVAGDRAVVACQDDDVVAVLPTAGGPPTLVATGEGSAPVGVAADPRGARAWITLGGTGELLAVELPAALPSGDSTRPPVGGARLPLGPDPRAIAVTPAGDRMFAVVSRWRATQTESRLYVADITDPAAPARRGVVDLDVERGRDSDTDNDGVLSFVDAVAPSPDGGRVVVAGLKANTVAGLARTGRPLTSQTTARAALAEVWLDDLDVAGEDALRRSLDDLDYVSAAVFAPDGDRLFAAVEGAEVVLALDAFTLDSAGSIDDVGHAPAGLALDPTGTRLFVDASLSREVRVYDVSDLRSEPPPLARVRTVDAEPLAPEVLAGAIVFHRSRDARMSRTRYLSCASCHRDGEGDGLVWDFTQRGEGLRNTIPLRGRAGLGHGPLHWTANFDEIQDFEHDIRAGQGGRGFLPDALFGAGTRDQTLGAPKAGLSPELDALAAYVSSLTGFGRSPHRRPGDAAWEDSRARGEAIFSDPAVGCASCHAPPRYTDSAFVSPGTPRLHDVGTLRESSGGRLGAALPGLDTPTLRGLWKSAPYLHDGSAQTLREVLRDRNAGDRHGVTSGLDEEDLADLEVFLLSLDDEAP